MTGAWKGSLKRGEHGMTLIEVLITILVLTVGILTTLTVFTRAGKAAFVAERNASLVSIAQRELEQLRPLPYARLGLSGSVSASAVEAPLASPAVSEALVGGGVVDPGPTPFSVRGVSGRIYRYVTWRSDSCPMLRAKVASELSTSFAHAHTEIDAALAADLCPGGQHTKRITVVVKADSAARPNLPVRLSTVAVDSAEGVLAGTGAERLSVDTSSVTGSSGGAQPADVSDPDSAYAAVTSQSFYLYDTHCDASARGVPDANHTTHDTALKGATCTGSSRPDLMGLTPPTGSVTDLLYDYSSEITRSAAGGLAVTRDNRADTCTSQTDYESSENTRRRSVHTWATPASASEWATAASGGRAALTFWTRTAATVQAAARLCVVARRQSTGEVIGSADYELPAWPGEPTQLAIAFDLAHTVMQPGERLLLTVRVPDDSAADVVLIYDHPAYQSSLSVSVQSDKKFVPA